MARSNDTTPKLTVEAEYDAAGEKTFTVLYAKNTVDWIPGDRITPETLRQAIKAGVTVSTRPPKPAPTS